MKNKKKLWIIIIIIIAALLLIGGGTTAIIVSNSQVNDGGKKEWTIDDNQTFTYSGEEIAPKVSNLDENEKAKVVYSYSEKKDENPIDDTYTTGLPKDAGTYYVKAALENDYKITTITIEPAEVKLEDIQVVYNQPFVSGNYFTSEMNIDQMEFEYEFTSRGTKVSGDVSLTSTFLSPSIKSYDYTFNPNDKNYKSYNGTIDIEVYAIVCIYDGEEVKDYLEVPFDSSFDYELTQRLGYDMPYFVDKNNNKFELGTKITEDLELHYIENVTNYSITYHLDGGENGENPVSYTIESKNIVFSNPTKKGYTFNGWYKEDTFITKVEGIDKGSTGNIELFAQFTLNEYTITYNLDGGNNSEENPFFIHVIDHVVLQDAVKTGYNFLGWYLNDSKVEELDNISSNITLEARYEIATFTISFETFGGTNITPISLKYNQDIMLDTNVSKLGYEFRAWYKDSLFTTIFKDTKMPAENLTLYARYNLVNYNITYNLDGGDNPNPYTYNIESSITLQDSYKEGSTFIGWYSEATFENKIETIENRTGDIELFARFSTNAYDIEFNTNGGNTINTIHAEYNDIIMLPDGVKEGYEFEGWFKDSSFETPVTKEYTVLGNVVLFAKYEAITYTITYNLNGGANGSNPASYTVETPTITLANATKNGYTFLGWYTESTFENKVEEITLGSTGNVELYARFDAIEYTITYNLNGGTNGSNPESYTIEDETIVLVDAAKNGYTFQGWYSESTFENRIYQIVTGSTGNVELFAKYDAVTYTVTYNLNGGDNGANPASYTIETPTITLANATKNGYTFAGWYTESTFENKVEEITLGSTGNVELFAKFDAIEYTITYNLNGGTNGANPTKYIIEDETIVLIDATKTGYTFLGWYSDSEFNTKVVQIAAGSTGNVELFAKYEAVTYTITYNLNGGVNGANPATYTIETPTITLANATKNGYTFLGWYSEATFENKVEEITLGSTGNVELYAKYEAIEYTITYNLNGGTNGSNPATYTIEDETIVLIDAVKNGYTFQGWYTESTFENRVYQIEAGSTGNVVLFAKFEAITYTITYNLNGGVNVSNPVTYTIETPTITLADATKNGYTFAGWYTESTFENKVEEIALGSTGNLVLFARFEAIEYTITYNLNGGTNGSNPESYTIEDETIVLIDAAKAGYTFQGWYSDSEFNTKVVQIAAGSTGNVELFVKFEVITYTITYNLNGGTNESNPANYTIETPTITLANATKTGYTFAGWYTESTFENKVEEIALGSTGDLVLFAKFEAIEYTITYNLNGGTNGSTPESYTIEDATIVLANASKTGYTFQGWYTESTFENRVYQIEAGSTGNVVLFAKFEAITYTITYNLNGGINGVNPENYTIEDATITLAQATKTGYTFAGWYTESTFENKVEEITLGSTGNLVLFAKYTPNTNTAYRVMHYVEELDGSYSLYQEENKAGTTDTLTNAVALTIPHFTLKESITQENIEADGSTVIEVKYDRDTYTVTFAYRNGLDSQDQFDSVSKNVKYGYAIGQFPEELTVAKHSYQVFDNENNPIATTTVVSGNVTYYVDYTLRLLSIAYHNVVTPIAEVEAEAGDSVELASASKDGYTFQGWATEANGAKVYDGLEVISMPSESLDLYAIWDVIEYTITYNLNGGVNGTNPENYTIETSTITLAQATRTGYTFNGWYSDNGFNTQVTQITLGSTGNVELFAKFTAVEYTITYNLNGGLNGSNPVIYTIETPTITLADATKTGYTFNGWYSESTFENKVEEITLGSTGNVELFAKFTATSYTITYNLNGGTNESNPESYTIEDATIVLANASKTGYTFQGWYTESTFENRVYQIEAGSTGNVELFAKFTAVEYTITYNLNGGLNGSNPVIYTIETPTITLADATKNGYTFNGWYSESTFENKVEEITLGSTGNVELFAKFTAVEYTITYNLNGGLSGSNPVTYTIETPTITLADATKNGYTFNGWYSDNGFNTQVTQITLGSTGNVELFAKFTAVEYTITYNLNGGLSGSNPVTYTIETPTITLADATKNGYTFNGWYSESTFENKVEEITLGSTGNVELFAKFTATSYTITYNLNDGVNGDNPNSYTIEDATIVLANASKTGYTFQGWYTESTFENRVYQIEAGSTGNVELFAKFTATSYTITYNLNGGLNGTNPATYTIETPTITLAQATRTGYTFNGWYSESTFENKVEEITLGSTGNVELFAKFTATSYTITYNLNGGLNGTNPATYTIETPTITLAQATRTGYTFNGWYSDNGFNTQVTQITLGSIGNVELFAKFTAVEYSITYNLNGGLNGTNPATYTIETPTITLAQATRTGYTFNGWYLDNGFNTQVTEITLGSTGNKVFYAKFTATPYTITYNLNGGLNGTNPATYTIETPTITLAQATKTGYTFNGWYSDNGFNTQVTQITLGSTGNLELFAKFTATSYTITYNLNGGVNVSNPESYTIETPTITLANATKNGYTFNGWYSDSEFNTQVTQIVKGSTGNKVFYAKFTVATYTITYNLDGGVNVSNPASYTIETSTITLAQATKTGYTFNGWYSDSGFNTQVTQIVKGSTGNKVFYAKFSPTVYTITYNLDGGVNGTNPPSYTILDTIDLVDATKDGFTFEGWYLEATFQTKVTEISNSTGNITLFAYFIEEGEALYTITYVLNGGTLDPASITKFNSETPSFTLLNPTKGNAYSFAGWYLDSAFTERILAVDTDEVQEDITVYAKWSAVKYTIIYYDGDDVITTLTPTSYTIDDAITLPTYNKFNHTFGGWYTEAGFVNKVTQIVAGTTGTIKLYAKTTDKGFTVNFYDTDGTTLLKTETTTTYGSVTAPSYTYDSNTYHFTWVNKANSEEVDLTSIDANYNLKVQLVLISYTATIYYTDADGYATTARSNAILTSVENTNLTFGDNVSLTRQMRITDASVYDFFYMSPVSTFDWTYAVSAAAKGQAYTNADGTISCIVETDGTNGTLIIIVYCIQPVAIITSSSQTLAYTENTNMSSSTYQFYKTIDEAFEAYSTASDKLLRIYGRQGTKIATHCLDPNKDTPIAAKSTTIGTYTITRPKITYYATDYALHNSYTINSNIILPYYRSCTDTTGYRLQNSSAASANYVHSVFVIDQDVTLTLSSELIVGGDICSGGTLYGHGVLINNGTLLVKTASAVTSYGFIKGTGNVIVEANATLTEQFTIYDWPGGANALGFYTKDIFPFESYSIHNVSCRTRIYAGATYLGWLQIPITETWIAKNIIVVGNGGLFQLSSGYVDKSIEETTTDLNTNTSYIVTNHNQTVRDVLDIHGDFVDNQISMVVKLVKKGITVKSETVATNTSMALPIGFMTIKISEGNGSLTNNSFKFLPGSKLIIERNATVTINNGVKALFYADYPDDYTYINGDTTKSGSTNDYSYQKIHSAIYTDGVINSDYYSELVVNGSLIVKGSLGGNVYTTSLTGTLNLSNASATLPKPTKLTYGATGSTCNSTNETVNASIYSLSNNSFAWSNAEAAVYSAISYNGEYGWTKNVNVTPYVVTYNINGQISQATINTTGNSYTFVESDLPNVELDGYVFGGWYMEYTYTTPALGQSISSNQTLYAKLTPIIYNIEYEIGILDDYDETDPMVNNNVTYFTFNDTVTFTDPTCGTLNFTGWFVDNNYSVNAPNITSSTLQYYKYLIDENNTIHLYGYFSSVAYYTIVYRTSEGIEIESIPTERIVAGESITIAAAMPSYQDTETIDTTLYAYKMVNFYKWYVVDSSAHVVAELNPGDTYTPTSSVTIVPNYIDGLTYVSIAQGSLSSASYKVTYSGGSGDNNSTFTVPVGTALSITFTFNESSNRSYTITAADGNNKSGRPSSATQTVSYTANSNLSIAASSEEEACVIEGTLVTLADGTQVPVENVKAGDYLKVFNHETGCWDVSYVMFNDAEELANYKVINLYFSDGTYIGIVSEHGFFDMDLLQYVYIDGDNYQDYIGHRFYSVNSIVVLESANITIEYTRVYSPVTAVHLNLITNGLLSMPGGVPGLFNIFDYDEDLKYDELKMNQDIDTYGLLDYSYFEDLIPYDVYIAFNGKYLGVAMAKGILTKENILYYIERYSQYW